MHILTGLLTPYRLRRDVLEEFIVDFGNQELVLIQNWFHS